jgi:hypothetical protein
MTDAEALSQARAGAGDRDIHTLSQQIQSREAHFAAIGQVLLGAPPAVFF